MYIKNLSLTNFRNYKNQTIEFCPKTNIIYGKNGQGKTNIIEGIYFFSNGKSFRCIKEKEVIKFNEEWAKIDADFVKEDYESNATIFLADKKSIKLNGAQIERLSEIVGEYNIVIFTPDYLNLVKEGPGIRRQFLDSFISQIKPSYFKNLIIYYKVLKQRNNLLKQKNKKMLSTLDVWDEKLASVGAKISKMRNEAIKKINETVNLITEDNNMTEKIELVYEPSIKGDFESEYNFFEQLKMTRERDLEKGITLTGPHRDDFDIFMNGINIKKFGSQGQMRSCVLKLKLSECEIIEEKTLQSPILLLDDIMSELDEERRKFFLNNIKNKQVIITCTDKEEFFDNSDSFVFRVEEGNIIKEK